MSTMENLITGDAYTSNPEDLDNHEYVEDTEVVSNEKKSVFSTPNIIIGIFVVIVILLFLYIAKRSGKKHNKAKLTDKRGSTIENDEPSYDITGEIRAFHLKQDRYISDNL